MSAAVPRIDIAALRADPHDAATTRAIGGACESVGFFTVTGHGVDPSSVADLDAAARRFFDLPDATKAEIAMSRGGRAWRGWFPLGGELTSGRPDRKEGLYFGEELAASDARVRRGLPLHGANLFPPQVPELRPAVLRYMASMSTLGRLLVGAIGAHVGLPGEMLEDILRTPTLLFRIFRYPPPGPAPEAEQPEGQWGVAEHTDYGLLTILAQDRLGGLEVKTPDGWREVPPEPDAFVCNLGDMLEAVTEGRLCSTAHRVRSPAEGDRLSFPFFFDPSWDALLPNIEGTYGDYLLAKVRRVFPALAGDL